MDKFDKLVKSVYEMAILLQEMEERNMALEQRVQDLERVLPKRVEPENRREYYV